MHSNQKYLRKKEMKHQVITFIFMIMMTFIAFFAIEFKHVISPMFTVPLILVMAVIQVIYQLYYFMHMKHTGHEMIRIFIYSGILAAFVIVLSFLTIVKLG